MSRELFPKLIKGDPQELKRPSKATTSASLQALGWTYASIDPGLSWLIIECQLRRRPKLTHETLITRQFQVLLRPVQQLLDGLVTSLSLPRSEEEEAKLRPLLGVGPKKDEGKLVPDTLNHLATRIRLSLTQNRRLDPWSIILQVIGQYPTYGDLMDGELVGRERAHLIVVLTENSNLSRPLITLVASYFSYAPPATSTS